MRTYVRGITTSRPHPLSPSDRAPGAVAGRGCCARASEASSRGCTPARAPLRGAWVTQVREGGAAVARPLPRRALADVGSVRVGRAGSRGTAGLTRDVRCAAPTVDARTRSRSHTPITSASARKRQMYVSATVRAMRNSRAAQGGQNATSSPGASSSSGSLPSTAIQPGASRSTHPHWAHRISVREPTSCDRTREASVPPSRQRVLPSRRPDSNRGPLHYE